MNSKIIGLGGLKQSGKGSAGDWFIKHGYREMAFAEPLKRLCVETFAIPYSDFHLAERKDQPLSPPRRMILAELEIFIRLLKIYERISPEAIHRMTARWMRERPTFLAPRHILQYMGTELVRQCVDTEFWCRAFKREASRHSRVVVTDVRFPNERQVIRDMHGKMILLQRAQATQAQHASEANLGTPEEYDLVLTNDGSLIELYQKLDRWTLEQLGDEKAGSQ